MKDFLRKYLAWFFPGMNIKRWTWLALFGLIVFSIGVHGFLVSNIDKELSLSLSVFLSEEVFFTNFFLIGGFFIFVLGVYRINQILIRSVSKDLKKGQLAGKVFVDQVLSHRMSVTVIGGGHGLSTLLRGLKAWTTNINAIVTVADSGGSSGMLRDEFGAIPQGDIRNCLVALAEDESFMERFFQYRFEKGKIKGHSLGNLILFALSEQEKNLAKGIGDIGKIFNLMGSVIPAANMPLTLIGEKENGAIVEGEANIPEKEGRIVKLWLKEKNVKATKEAIEAIRKSDLIIFGPGSLFTSVLANLLIEDLSKEIKDSKACKIYISNMMTQKGETNNMSVEDHMFEIVSKIGNLDYIILNKEVSEKQKKRYAERGVAPLEYDLINLLASGVKPVVKSFTSEKKFAHHDSEKLGQCVYEIAKKWRKKK